MSKDQSPGESPQKRFKTHAEIEESEKENFGRGDELPYYYERIKALLWIKDSKNEPVYKEALEEWDRELKYLISSIERKEKQIALFKNEIYNVIGFYSVFQGVVFQGVAQGNEKYFTCIKVIIPIVLSVLASIVTSIGIWEKQSKIQSLQNKLSDDNRYKTALEKHEYRLRQDPKNFSFANLEKIGEGGTMVVHKETSWGRIISPVSPIVFTIFLSFSYAWLLCRP